MLRINADNSMTATRKNTVVFNLTLQNYTFEVGDIATFTVRKTYGCPPVIQCIQSCYNSNRIIFELSSVQMDIPSGTYIYDITVTLRTGEIDTVIPTNNFIVLEGVTNE